MRVDRLAHGNPGQMRVLAGGISELKIDVGQAIAFITPSLEACLSFFLQEETSPRRQKTLAWQRPWPGTSRSDPDGDEKSYKTSQDQDGCI